MKRHISSPSAAQYQLILWLPIRFKHFPKPLNQENEFFSFLFINKHDYFDVDNFPMGWYSNHLVDADCSVLDQYETIIDTPSPKKQNKTKKQKGMKGTALES